MTMEDPAIKAGDTETLLKLSLRDVLVFVNWIQQVQEALDGAQPLPAMPELESARVRSWVELIQKLDERSRQAAGKEAFLQASLDAQESELGRLVSHLHENIASLYENLGQEAKAQEVRRRASAIQAL